MDKEFFNHIRENIEGMELDALWDYAIESSPDYRDQCEFFFDVLAQLIQSGAIELVNMYTKQPLNGPIEGLLKTFRSSFPTNSVEMNGGLWFFSSSCPAGPLWTRNN